MCYGMGCLYEDGYTGECTVRNGRRPCEDELYRADSDPRESWQEDQEEQEEQEGRAWGAAPSPRRGGKCLPEPLTNFLSDDGRERPRTTDNFPDTFPDDLSARG